MNCLFGGEGGGYKLGVRIMPGNSFGSIVG